MGARVLRVNDIEVAFAGKRSRARSRGLVRRFRFRVETGDWDERFLKLAERIDRAALLAAGMLALYVVSIGIRTLV